MRVDPHVVDENEIHHASGLESRHSSYLRLKSLDFVNKIQVLDHGDTAGTAKPMDNIQAFALRRVAVVNAFPVSPA
jgi:hypothetical protein